MRSFRDQPLPCHLTKGQKKRKVLDRDWNGIGWDGMAQNMWEAISGFLLYFCFSLSLGYVVFSPLFGSAFAICRLCAFFFFGLANHYWEVIWSKIPRGGFVPGLFFFALACVLRLSRRSVIGGRTWFCNF
ncbi:uncharacterized protein PV06_02194 [Exophiala oligosperma]|uniref:Uncharacterized protein n=1 Tax=Exophiala oligosperma TaxID=215243 RepID=A0A0D2B2Z3_9EURO|nr:uncharacterized protein PV06_02194 [Exophiala oligosperma]KIW46526.1 hypothetical protein PV06_02194 [Exophiala oligosperma]